MVHFLKLKFSASGYPKEYTGTAESRNHFLKMLHDLDGISLAPEEVYDPANAPLKTLSKYLVKYFAPLLLLPHLLSFFQRAVGKNGRKSRQFVERSSFR